MRLLFFLVDIRLPHVLSFLDLIKILCRDIYVFSEIYRKLLIESVDDEIKQMLFFRSNCLFGLVSHYFQTDTSSNPM